MYSIIGSSFLCIITANFGRLTILLVLWNHDKNSLSSWSHQSMNPIGISVYQSKPACLLQVESWLSLFPGAICQLCILEWNICELIVSSLQSRWLFILWFYLHCHYACKLASLSILSVHSFVTHSSLVSVSFSFLVVWLQNKWGTVKYYGNKCQISVLAVEICVGNHLDTSRLKYL